MMRMLRNDGPGICSSEMDSGSFPRISVIVLNWNGRHFLEDCLTSLRRQKFRDFEVILIDNGSRDGSVDFVSRQFPEVLIVALQENLGFELGNLAGFNQARGELIFLLNNDTEADPQLLTEVERASRLFPEAGSFATKMVYFEDRNVIDNCGSQLTPAGFPVCVGRGERQKLFAGNYQSIFAACAGAAAYRRRLIADVGFLDPDFFMAFQDLDLAFRGQLRGYGCILVPNAIVYHHSHATVGRMPAEHVFYAQRNIEFVYLKNMPLGLAIRFAPARLLYEIASGLYYTRLGYGWAYMKGKLAAAWHVSALLRKRRQIQRLRMVSNRQMRSLMMRGWFKARARNLWSVLWKPNSRRLELAGGPELRDGSA